VSRVVIPKRELLAVLEQVQERYLLVAPVREQGILDFKAIKEVEKIDLSDDLTYKSPKEFLFPQVEPILRFTGTGELTEIKAAPPTVILGVRPCDLAAIKIMTAVFTSGKYVDAGFADRLAQTVLIGLGCLEPKQACFCNERAVDWAISPNCDLFLTDRGEYYTAEVFSVKGQAILAGFDFAVINDAAAKPVDGSQVSTELLEINAAENDLFTEIDWERLTEKCLGCGMCTYICPTCHCFAFKDVAEKGVTTRYKCWDSCLYPRFTLHASGHNPRSSKLERYRQRVLHKYLYVKQNFGYIACTGCGRCIRSCPAGMNIQTIVKTINKLSEAPKEKQNE
jgi:sulfhydrogenase subunit beta (sulfur reductase)